MHSSLRTCIQYLHRQEGQVSKTAPNNNYDEEDIRPTINKNLHNMRAVVLASTSAFVFNSVQAFTNSNNQCATNRPHFHVVKLFRMLHAESS